MTQEGSATRDPLAEALQGVAKDDYGDSHREHCLEIYKTYLELADHISERREKANTFFLAVNTALTALLAKDALGDASPGSIWLFVPLAGLVLCYLWNRIIRAYRDLSSAKFRVVHAIERGLPLRPYNAEWEAVGRGEVPRLYLPFTHVERFVPWVFMVFYALFITSGIVARACDCP